MRIAVVDALARGRGVRYSTFDVVGAGPRVVAGIAETLGHRAGLLTYEEAVGGGLDASVVDAVFISAMTTDMGAVVNLSRLLKNRARDIVVVAGGPIGFSWRQLLSGSKGVDLVVVGEAEPVLPGLLDVLDREGLEGLKTGKVPALAYKSSSGDPFLTSPHLHASVQEITRFKHWSRVSLVYKPVGVYRYYVEVARGCSNFYRPILREL
ncbi:MAG: B12-binding domain-containing radical SAM protein, partial [Thermogladius sp.]|nr:B12-binding domain-containing radical SAM protein [Thermogladius sp.]